jgi:hypothetical protein
MWPSLVKIRYTELKLCGNDPVVRNYIYSNGDLWPNNPKKYRVFPFHRGIMWPSLVKIQYTELKLSCGNLCGRPPVARHAQSHNTARLETGVYKLFTWFNNNGLLTTSSHLSNYNLVYLSFYIWLDNTDHNFIEVMTSLVFYSVVIFL